MANSVLKMPEENERVFRVFLLLSRCCSSSMAQRFKAVAIFFQVSNIAHDALTNYCSSSCRSFVASMKNPFFSGARYGPWNCRSSASASMSSELALLADAPIPEIIRTIVLFRLRLRSATGFFSLSVFPSLKSLVSLSLPLLSPLGLVSFLHPDPHTTWIVRTPVLRSTRPRATITSQLPSSPVFPATRTKNLSTEKQTPNDAIAAATSNVLLLQQLYGLLLLLPCVRKPQNNPKTVSQEKTQEKNKKKKKKNQMR